jgi:enamine deaminase RidA (YjgF/YER057c/UK114 family)
MRGREDQTMTVAERLRTAGITLPAATPPGALYVPTVQTGNLLFVAGHTAKREGKPWVGQLGAGMATAEGREAARSIAIDLLGTLQAALGDLERVKRIVKLMVLVNSAPTFTEQHLVANGASELLVTIFGERGPHARSAFGVAQIPTGSCVEIEMIVEVR